jgi:deazaflavin-dependent oxidoreductase (nitroreductase family)
MAEMPSDMIAHNRQVIEDFRTNGAPPGRPLLLLSTTGRRTGEVRTTPMMYVRLDGRLHVIASNSGAKRHPQWYRNLRAESRVRVEVGDEAFDAIATPLEGEERDAAFARIAADHPFFADHQAGVKRTIPVVALDKTG